MTWGELLLRALPFIVASYLVGRAHEARAARRRHHNRRLLELPSIEPGYREPAPGMLEEEQRAHMQALAAGWISDACARCGHDELCHEISWPDGNCRAPAVRGKCERCPSTRRCARFVAAVQVALMLSGCTGEPFVNFGALSLDASAAPQDAAGELSSDVASDASGFDAQAVGGAAGEIDAGGLAGEAGSAGSSAAGQGGAAGTGSGGLGGAGSSGGASTGGVTGDAAPPLEAGDPCAACTCAPATTPSCGAANVNCIEHQDCCTCPAGCLTGPIACNGYGFDSDWCCHPKQGT